MKKKTKTIGVLLTGIALAVGIAVSGGVIPSSRVVDETLAATTYSHTITGKTWESYGAQTLSGVSWTAAATGGAYWDYDATKGQQFGSKNSPAKSLTLSTSGISGSISSVSISTSGASSVVASIGVSVGGSQYGGSPISITELNAKYTFSGNATGDIIFTWTQTSSKALYLKAIEIEYSSKTLSSISVSGTLAKTLYYAGESFDSAGLTINANYSDSSTADVTSECTFSPDPLTAGVTSVTASYTEGEVTKTVDIGGFSVSTRSVTSISVLTNPTKTSYTIGQSFDPTGMKIRAVYNVGPTNDDYVAYTYAPTSVFDSVGEKTITITSTENASAVTALTVNVVDFPEGTYSITSGATSYQDPMNPDSLIIDKSDSELPALSFLNINNVRLYGSPITGSIMIGSKSSIGASFTISLNSNLYVSKVEFIGNDKDTGADGTETLAINGASVNFSTINTEDSIVFKPYSNSINIATSARLWVEEIIITAHTASSSAVDYGTHFLTTTADECSSLSVSLGTWNNLKGLYDNADADVQNVIKAADADVGGSDLEKAIARYTFIAEKYGYDDFMNLGISSSSNNTYDIGDNTPNVAIILIVSLVGASVLVGYRLMPKKKED